jgi:hypothetical protein
VLIDGPRLAELMIQCRVGVQVKKTYDVVEVDEDSFHGALGRAIVGNSMPCGRPRTTVRKQ